MSTESTHAEANGAAVIDVAVIGAGAAGLMAAISAGRRAQELGRACSIVAFDGARKIGAKILVAGGGRCNVTHDVVTEHEYAGWSSPAVRNVLRRFDANQTVRFFDELGVELKREDTGKLFPVTNKARTVLNALLGAASDAGARIRHPARMYRVALRTAEDGSFHGFTLDGELGTMHAKRLILATGGKALPKSGSDGAGYAIAEALGHSITPRVFPALVPLVLDGGSVLRSLGGVTLPARLELRSSTGKRLKTFTDSTLCTHFGLSGPSAMDMSRYLTAARFEDPGAHLVACWLPDAHRDEVDATLQALGKRSVGRWLREHLPERLATALCEAAKVDPSTCGQELSRDARRAVVGAVFEFPLPVTGDRGYSHAEVTAGGIPQNEVKIATMISKRCEGLFFCGEICDVDGRIGGYNFQWAWATGHIAGASAVDSLGA